MAEEADLGGLCLDRPNESRRRLRLGPKLPCLATAPIRSLTASSSDACGVLVCGGTAGQTGALAVNSRADYIVPGIARRPQDHAQGAAASAAPS